MRLGHFALSQTVSRFNSSSKLAVKLLAFPKGTLRFSQRGRRLSVGWASNCTSGKLADLSEIPEVGVDLDTVLGIK